MDSLQRPFKAAVFLLDKPQMANPIFEKTFFRLVQALHKSVSQISDPNELNKVCMIKILMDPHHRFSFVQITFSKASSWI